MKRLSVEIAGWVGVLLTLAAFMSNVAQVLQVTDPAYLLMNAVGAVGLIVSSLRKKDFQPVAVNVVWLIVAIGGLVQALVLY